MVKLPVATTVLPSGDTASAQTSSLEFGYGRAPLASTWNDASIAPVVALSRAIRPCFVPFTQWNAPAMYRKLSFTTARRTTPPSARPTQLATVAPVVGSSSTRFLRATPLTVPKLPPTISCPFGLTASVCTALSNFGLKPVFSTPVVASYATR